MAGKRLIDVAKLLNAGQSIAKQHIVLRQQQWDVYSKTSSLAKAVKHQTDRVTVTAGAAYELAKRFNENAPSWNQQQEQARRGYESAKDRVAREVAAYDSSRAEDPAQPSRSSDVLFGADGRPQETGTQKQQDDKALSSVRKRELQRQAERQIPAVAADAQVETYGQDTFSARTESTSPELSSLPRAKVPKHSEGKQSDHEHVPDEKLNQDVYYTASHDNAAGQAQAGNGTSNDLNTDIFYGRRVSQILGSTGSDTKNPYAKRQKMPPKPLPEMVAAQERWEQQRKESTNTEASDDVGKQEQTSNTGDADTQKLAASIAQEAEVSTGHPRVQCAC